MEYRQMQNTELCVSELCFGLLPMGPLQKNLSVEEGADLIVEAMENGVTFFDTAELYQSYPHLARALSRSKKDVVISGKSTAASYAEMEKAITDCLRTLKRDYVDLFHLHAARVSGNVLEQRSGAFQCLRDYKQKGYIRAIGISTHAAAAVLSMADVAEMDVLFPLFNKTGMGLVNCTLDDMRAAVDKAYANGKALFSMKLLSGGHLVPKLQESIAFGRAVPAFSAHAIGMTNFTELRLNLRIFNDETIDEAEVEGLTNGKRMLLSPNLCRHCGTCVDFCHNGALERREGQPPYLHQEKCLLCGYCAAACPEFAIRII